MLTPIFKLLFLDAHRSQVSTVASHISDSRFSGHVRYLTVLCSVLIMYMSACIVLYNKLYQVILFAS